MTALPPSGTFVMVDPAHIAEVGPAAAVLFARICWRADRDGFWKASRAVLAQETGLSPDTVRGALRILRERSWLKGERASRDDATMVWSPVLAGQNHVGDFPRGSGDIPHVPDVGNIPISSLETVETTTTPTADAVPEEAEAVLDYAADEALPMLVAVPDLPSEPVEKREADGPPKTAQTLVARWVDGYRSTNDGADPPGPLMGRVAGQCRNVAKACKSHDDWVASYAASYAGGRESRADITALMGRRVQRYGKVNHDLAIYQNLAAGGTSGALTGPGATALGMLTSASSTNPPGDTP